MSYLVPQDLPKFCNECPFGHLRFQHPWHDIHNRENDLQWGFGCNLLKSGTVAVGKINTNLPKPINCPLKSRASFLSIYSRYHIKHIFTYSYSSPDYDDLVTRTEVEEFDMDGCEFLSKVIAKSVQDREFSSISTLEKSVFISFFDPMSGNTSDHRYDLEEVANI